MRTALDTNVISALWSNEPSAARISIQLSEAYNAGGLVISAPVYAELQAHPASGSRLADSFLRETGVVVDFVLDEDVWRLTAKTFAAYADRRRRSGGGLPKRLLVDFVIAAHALLHADRLMTLDPSRYKQDFPQLHIV